LELALNLVWLLLTGAMVCLWLRLAPRAAAERRTQFAALALVILILLPAISMTDDLMTARNPAEVDSCLRRDHEILSPHAIVPAIATLPVPAFAGLCSPVVWSISAGVLRNPLADSPTPVSLQNRPPPAA